MHSSVVWTVVFNVTIMSRTEQWLRHYYCPTVETPPPPVPQWFSSGCVHSLGELETLMSSVWWSYNSFFFFFFKVTDYGQPITSPTCETHFRNLSLAWEKNTNIAPPTDFLLFWCLDFDTPTFLTLIPQCLNNKLWVKTKLWITHARAECRETFETELSAQQCVTLSELVGGFVRLAAARLNEVMQRRACIPPSVAQSKQRKSTLHLLTSCMLVWYFLPEVWFCVH